MVAERIALPNTPPHRLPTGPLARLALVLLSLIVLVSASTASAIETRALLIGVSRYQALPGLPGAANDVGYIRAILESRLGFDPAHIEELRDEGATREGILAALDRLADETPEGALVYLHYSGHGSQVPDLDGDEGDDGLDESLVPHDGRTPGVRDVSDDELAERLGRLSGTVIVVLDSCHSGTATRASQAAVRTRVVPPDRRRDLYATKGPRTRAVVTVDRSNHVLFTAAHSTESALDAPVDGRPHGLFSHALGRALGELGGTASPKHLLERAGEEHARVQSQLQIQAMPTPQLEATAERLDAPLLAGAPQPTQTPSARPSAAADPARLPWSHAEPREDGVALLDALALGGQVGSMWGLYPDGERDFPVTGLLATVRVEKTEGGLALAGYVSGRPIEGPARAIRLTAPPAPIEAEIAWRGGTTKLRAEVGRLLRSSGIRAVIRDEPAFPVLTVVVEGDRARLLGVDGETLVDQVASPTSERVANALRRRLERRANAVALMALDNPASRMRLSMKVVGAPPPPTSTSAPVNSSSDGMRAIVLVADTAPPPIRIKRPGEARTPANSLQLEIRTDRDCHLTIANLDIEGRIHLLFPNPLSEQRGFLPAGLIRGGATNRIPDALASGNRAGFFLDYGPPAGRDTFVAHCAEALALAEMLRARLRDPGPSASGTGPSRGSEGSPADLPMRSFIVVGDEANRPGAQSFGDWTTARTSIEVQE